MNNPNLWLLIAVLAYFLNACALTTDKFLLSKKIRNPAIYAIFICLLSVLAMAFWLIEFKPFGLPELSINLAAGFFFAAALVLMFQALDLGEASRVTPFISGIQPVFVLIMAWLFLGESLSLRSGIAFIMIVTGSILVSLKKGESNPQAYLLALFATFLFAASYALNKFAFVKYGFVNTFVLTRLGCFFAALVLLSFKRNRFDILYEFRKPKQERSQTGWLFMFGQGAGAMSAVLVSWAISLSSSVALVNALQGIQQAFLFVIIFILTKFFPKIMAEDMSLPAVAQKVSATALIIAGLFLL